MALSAPNFPVFYRYLPISSTNFSKKMNFFYWLLTAPNFDISELFDVYSYRPIGLAWQCLVPVRSTDHSGSASTALKPTPKPASRCRRADGQFRLSTPPGAHSPISHRATGRLPLDDIRSLQRCRHAPAVYRFDGVAPRGRRVGGKQLARYPGSCTRSKGGRWRPGRNPAHRGTRVR